MFLMRVDELDDPVAFLSGARIPLYPPDGIYPPGYKGPIIQRAEWVSDTVLAEIKYGANMPLRLTPLLDEPLTIYAKA